MKKLTTIVLSFLFLTFNAAKAEFAVGITGALHSFDVSGTETIRTSGEKNTGSHSEDVMVPELFVETASGSGLEVGISYIPTREMGSKSRTDSGDQSAGTYKAEAELDNVIQLYADIDLADVGGYPVYAKIGLQHATITTLESLNSGSSYPDQDVVGYTIGLGTKGDVPTLDNAFYKAEVTYTDFEDYSAESNSTPANKVEADLEDIALKLSIGYKF